MPVRKFNPYANLWFRNLKDFDRYIADHHYFIAAFQKSSSISECATRLHLNPTQVRNKASYLRKNKVPLKIFRLSDSVFKELRILAQKTEAKDQWDFYRKLIRTWQTAGSFDEVAKNMNLPKKIISHRIWVLRHNKVPLKYFNERNVGYRFKELASFAKELGNEKGAVQS